MSRFQKNHGKTFRAISASQQESRKQVVSLDKERKAMLAGEFAEQSNLLVSKWMAEESRKKDYK